MRDDSTPTSSRAVRGADRDRHLLDRADPTSEDRLLPGLEAGITLLDVDGDPGVPVLQSLVLDHLLLHDGPAFWVDTEGHATTTTLTRLSPSRRVLDRIHVARGFTAYQHHGAVHDLSAAVDRTIQRSTGRGGPPAAGQGQGPRPPTLVAAPAVDAQYRTADTLGTAQARTLQARTLARLAAYADGYDVPVLLTRSEADSFAAPVATAADRRLECEQTRLGPRFVGDGIETLGYPVADGAYYQTTFAYWRRLLHARAAQVGVDPSGPSHPAGGPQGTETDVPAGGETAAPLLDACADAGSR